MGVLITAACEKCDYSRDLRVGGGLNDLDQKAVANELPDDARKELEDDIKNGASDVSISRKPSICTRCGNIYSSSVVSYKLGKRKKQLTDNCPDCGSSQKTFLPDDGKYVPHCPKCGGKIEFKQTGHWD